MVTRKDVALKAKVSEATVSFVINNSKNVTSEVKERVLAAVKELNYQPNLVARSLVTKQTKHVAMLIDNLKNPYYCEILEGAQWVASKAGYIVSVISIDNSNKQDILELASRGVDGVVLALVKEFEECYQLNIPYVCDEVFIDYKKAIFDMVECLVKKGHKKIGFLSGISLRKPNHVRYRCFIDALKQSGLTPNERLIVDANLDESTDEKAGEDAMKELLLRKEEFTAVFAINDLMALGAMKAIRDAGLNIPQDISIVGCDYLKMLDYVAPTLSTLDVEAFKVGCSLMEKLLDTIKGEACTKEIIQAKFLCKDSIAQAKNN